MEYRCNSEILQDLVKKQHDMNVLLAVYNEQLKTHIKRSDRLESVIEKVEKRSYNLAIQLYLLVGASTMVNAAIFLILKGMIGG